MVKQKKTGRKVVTLSKPYLVEGRILRKGTKVLIESEDYLDAVTPADTGAPELAVMRKFRRMDEPFLAEEDDTLLDEEGEVEAEIAATMRKLRRLQRMKKMDADDELKEEDDELKEEDELEEADLEGDREDPIQMRRLRRMRQMRKMDLADSDGTPAGNEGAFTSEIENSEGDMVAMRRMARARAMRRAMKRQDAKDDKDSK
jgi:vacuolar-type H+-ATPase subunit I/STV1